MMDSIWQSAAELPRFPALEEDIQTEVLVIGGGLAGLLCAWRLREAGVDCVLMEKDRIMVITISGRGDKDCAAIARYRGEDIRE